MPRPANGKQAPQQITSCRPRAPPQGLAGRGKRGGVRVIYYLRSRQGGIWVVTLYAKNEVGSIPGHGLKKIKEGIEGGA